MAFSKHTELSVQPHVSVVMVNYNTRELTLEAIDSVYASVCDHDFIVEVIVVDNASADGSSDAIEARFPQVRMVRSPNNLGFGRGNNLGATFARGKVLLLLNTDTIVRPSAIQILYRVVLDEPSRGIAGPFLENPDGSYQCSMISFPTAWRTFCTFFWLNRLFPHIRTFADATMAHADPNQEIDVDVIQGASMMIRRDVFEQIGGFDPAYFMYYEESDLCKRVHTLGYSSRYAPSARVLHLVSQSSRAHPWWFFKILRESRTIYARKHMSVSSRMAMEVIVHAAYALRIVVYPLVGIINPRFRLIGKNILKSYMNFASPFAARKNVNA